MIFKYELKKILGNRVNLIAMLIGYIIMMITVILPITSESASIYKTDTSYQGLEAVRYKNEFAKEQTDYLTEDYLAKELTRLQEMQLDLETEKGFLTAEDEFGQLFTYLVNSYADIKEQEFIPNRLNALDLSIGSNFYERRIEKINDFLNMDFSYGNYSKAEKEYWIAKAKDVTIPFKWGDKTVPEYYRTILGLGFYLLFVIIVCIAPVFAGENESRASGIILAARHGKGKMIYAKILASFIFAIGYVCIGYLVSCSILYLLVGNHGFDLPVQLLANEIPYEMNMGQLLLLQLLVSFVMVFFTVALILFISAFTKSSIGTMATMLFLLVGPAFLGFSKSSALWNHILALTTIRLVDLKNCLVSFIDYKIGNRIIGIVPFSIATHLMVGLIILILCRSVFVKRTIR